MLRRQGRAVCVCLRRGPASLRAVAALAFVIGACGSKDDGSDKSGSSSAGSPGAADTDEPGALDVAPPPSPRREEHPVFSFADNRLLAHWQRGGALWIPTGSGSLAKYMRFGMRGSRWKLRQQRDGVPVAIPKRPGSLSVPLTEAQAAAAASVTVRVHSTESRRLTIRVNGNKAKDDSNVGRVGTGWNTVTIPLDTNWFQPGPNKIELRFSHGTPPAVAWIQIGGSALAADAEAPRFFDPDASSFVVGDGDGVAYYVQVPDKGHLVADVVGDGCRVNVNVRDHAGEVITGTLSRGSREVDLSGLAGKVVRIDLTAGGCALTRMAGAALTIPGTAPVRLTGKPPKNVILWVMDTLRGDRVRTVTPGARAEIPTMQRLAKTGAAFRQYFVEGNESQTSHSSIWTSLYPVNHKVITAGPNTNYILFDRYTKLGNVLKGAGLHTVAVTANGTISKWARYHRGFDHYENLIHDGTGRRLKHHLPADLILERAASALEGKTGEPFFLFMGTIDNHKPWVGHQPWLSRYDPGPYKGRFKTEVLSSRLKIPPGTHHCIWTPPPREMQRILAIYDSAVSYQDAVVGKLLAKLEDWGVADDTMLILTADHGEELWEYKGKCGHGSSLRQSLVHVPLLIHYPPLIPGGAVLEGADGVDILPTILDALGKPPLEAAQGQSLLPLLQGIGRGYVRPSYASMNEMSHTMRLGKWKMWVGRTARPSVYDITADPDERDNLAADRLFERQLLTDALSTFLVYRKVWKRRNWGVASNMTARAATDLGPANGVNKPGFDQGD